MVRVLKLLFYKNLIIIDYKFNSNFTSYFIIGRKTSSIILLAYVNQDYELVECPTAAKPSSIGNRLLSDGTRNKTPF
jgi:hypothetical protein